MFCTLFTDRPVAIYASAKASDTAAFGRFFRAMLAEGIYLAQSQFEAGYASTAHTPEVVDATLGVTRRASQAV